jgi:ADP-ribosylglycohydrolase
MLGAIVGDVIGSPYERWSTKIKDFPLFTAASCFTDDTVMTVAIAEAILDDAPFVDRLKRWYHRHPHVGYGKIFAKWAAHPTDRDPYQSWGNGAAMRVSPVAWAYDDLETVMRAAGASAAVTHDHPDGIQGAEIVAGCIFLARTGATKDDIRAFARGRGYALTATIEQIRAVHSFDVSSIGSIPPAIEAFLSSTDFEDAVRNAVSLGGDSDTQACIAGAIAEGFYGGVPDAIQAEALSRLTDDIRGVVERATAAWVTRRRTTMGR